MIQSDEKQGSTTKITQQSSHVETKDRQRASQTRKAKGVHHHQTSII